MSAETTTSGSRPLTSRFAGRSRGGLILAGVIVVVVVLMVLSTKKVSINSAEGAPAGAFSPSTYAAKEFPKVQKEMVAKAVAAPTLATALKANSASATKRYANDVSGQPVFSVSFTGRVGKGTDGIFPVTVAGMPKGVLVRLQTGPAIDGTDIRDATKLITFPQFKNQIDYQNAGSALNNVVKKQILGSVDRTALPGKTVTVTGAFTRINPAAWLVTPVKLAVS